jgi:esterase/lipase superfamily enzyme
MDQKKVSIPLQQGQYSGVRDLGPASIKYGVCEVTIPPNHKSGHVEGPKWWKLEFSSDPRQHIYLSSVSQIGKQGIEASMDAHFNQMRDIPRRRLLLFVHGYNVSFEEAALRTAQMHFDLDFQGLSAFFSWPSDGTTRAYVSDSGDIEWSKPHIAEVLSYYETNPNIDDIFVIAHSMGNRGTLQALLELRNRGAGKKIKEIILAAPDVDAVIFDRDIAPSISSYFPRTTIYASSNDMALRGSQTLNAIERVGEIRNNEPTVRTIPKLDVIDASSVSTDLLGHSYFGDGTSIISDMYYLMHKEVSPPRFNMTSKTGARGSFWKIK